jgi:hypothetical protein
MSVATLEVDASQIADLGKLMAEAGQRAPAAIGRAIRRTGDMTRTQMVRSLTAQSGLKRKVIVKAIKAKSSGLTYTLASKGGNVHLQYFGARETRKGVSAAPWNHRRVFSGMFIKGGRFPKRVPLGLGGAVFARTGAGRLPIASQRSGLFIPKEMVSGATAAAFTGTVQRVLPARLAHEMAAIFGGAVSG